MARIAILADSGCQMKSTDGIYIVPLQVSIGTESYQDGVTIDSLTVFQRMQSDPECMPKTSQPSSGDIVAALTKIKEEGYDEVVAVTIATGLSSTLSGVKMAADIVDIPVRLVDSKGTAGNQRYLVETAKRYVEEGKSSEEIASRLEKLVEHSATVIMAPNLKHLKRGGRITPAVAALAGMLKIVPVMKLNLSLGGKIDTLTKVRTIKRAKVAMVEDMIKNGVNSSDYVVTVEHVLCEQQAQELMDEIREKIGQSIKIHFDLLPSVVGAHMGIGGMGLQYIKKASD